MPKLTDYARLIRRAKVQETEAETTEREAREVRRLARGLEHQNAREVLVEVAEKMEDDAAQQRRVAEASLDAAEKVAEEL